MGTALAVFMEQGHQGGWRRLSEGRAVGAEVREVQSSVTGSGLGFKRIRRLLCSEWTVGGPGPLAISALKAFFIYSKSTYMGLPMCCTLLTTSQIITHIIFLTQTRKGNLRSHSRQMKKVFLPGQ